MRYSACLSRLRDVGLLRVGYRRQQGRASLRHGRQHRAAQHGLVRDAGRHTRGREGQMLATAAATRSARAVPPASTTRPGSSTTQTDATLTATRCASSPRNAPAWPGSPTAETAARTA
jgi:hypothetical protein